MVEAGEVEEMPEGALGWGEAKRMKRPLGCVSSEVEKEVQTARERTKYRPSEGELGRKSSIDPAAPSPALRNRTPEGQRAYRGRSCPPR